MKIDAIYSYDNHSKTMLAIKEKLGDVKVINHENSKFVGDITKTVLNWGCSDLPRQVRACKVINPENAVRLACNKLYTMRSLSVNHKIRLPKWTEDVEEACKWKGKIYCRTKLTGHDGEGVEIRASHDLIYAKLYTEQIGPPEEIFEYRINVFRDDCIARQKKVRRRDHVGKYNPEIKTTNGGYGFDVVDKVPLGIIPMAIEATKTLGLDYAGVDVVYYNNTPYILEVNTAPQFTPFVVNKFVQELKEI